MSGSVPHTARLPERGYFTGNVRALALRPSSRSSHVHLGVIRLGPERSAIPEHLAAVGKPHVPAPVLGNVALAQTQRNHHERTVTPHIGIMVLSADGRCSADPWCRALLSSHGGPAERSLPLRQRQEVQEVLSRSPATRFRARRRRPPHRSSFHRHRLGGPREARSRGRKRHRTAPIEETDHEFFIHVLHRHFGEAWHEEQLAKPTAERHLVEHWVDHWNAVRARGVDEVETVQHGAKLFSTTQTGDLKALLCSAFRIAACHFPGRSWKGPVCVYLPGLAVSIGSGHCTLRVRTA